MSAGLFAPRKCLSGTQVCTCNLPLKYVNSRLCSTAQFNLSRVTVCVTDVKLLTSDCRRRPDCCLAHRALSATRGKMGSSLTKPPATKWYPEFVKALPDAAFAGKTYAITGTTTGTGLVLAATAASRGANVILLNRKSDRATVAVARVRSAAASGAVVTAIDCDLQSFASVLQAVVTVRKVVATTGLDVLCCNAGVMALPDAATADGYDVQMQTNHLSHFLLVKELFPLLELAASRRGESRVVMHTSLARKNPPYPLDAKYLGKNGGALGGDSSYLGMGARWDRYHQTKLANALFSHALAEKLRARGSRVKAVCAAPGLAATQLFKTASREGAVPTAAMELFNAWGTQSAEDGAMPLLHACAGVVENGELWEPGGLGHCYGLPIKVPLEPICTDKDSQFILWTTSEAACGKWAV